MNPAPRGDRRLWARRAVTVLVAWAVTWLFTSWWYLRPDPVGLLALVLVAATAWWLISDHRTGWEPSEWSADLVGRRLRTVSDSRLGYLRRIANDSGGGTSRGAPAAAALQGVLRDLATARVRDRTVSGAAPNTDPASMIEAGAPTLARYLFAQPPPRLDPNQLSRIIDRIEEL
ncbi:hypothetical protein [Flexivirga meconopsidis]|uniref:hypothetical protein n=1 Tax=Flexivirga meconopsidis TaxID=2977121 RepID=UPI00223FB25F|nr:hypothetical protein [Flexivirga meconopsidis]